VPAGQYAQFTTAPAATRPLDATPLLLFDSRKWTGMPNTLVNEGSLGPGLVMTPILQNGGSAGEYFRGDTVTNNSFRFLGNQLVRTWAQLGGNNAAGGWTLMAVVNLRAPEAGFTYRIPNMDGQHQASWSTITGVSSLQIEPNIGPSVYRNGPVTPMGPWDFAQPRADGTRIGTELQPGLMVVHYDLNWKLIYLWINGVMQVGAANGNISFFPTVPGFGPRVSSASVVNMNAGLINASVPSFNVSAFMGEQRRTSAPAAGTDEYVYGCGALAVFRGMPDGQDLRDWQTYFVPPGQKFAPQPLLRYLDTAGDYSFTVPTRPAPHAITRLRVRALGAGFFIRYPAYFDIPVVGGDLIEVTVGGVGLPGDLGGFGGYPDGGRGGLNTFVDSIPDKRGMGGSGSCRIHRNGTLMAVLGGGGGRGSFWNGTTSSFQTNGNGAGVAGPYYQPGTLNGGNAGTNAPSDGGGGTTLNGGPLGAGGTGGSAGSSYLGGNGRNVNSAGSFAQRPAGGAGGGGGVNGGGGGGINSAPAFQSWSRGGGAGSNFFHASLTFPIQLFTIGTTSNQDARLWFFEG